MDAWKNTRYFTTYNCAQLESPQQGTRAKKLLQQSRLLEGYPGIKIKTLCKAPVVTRPTGEVLRSAFLQQEDEKDESERERAKQELEKAEREREKVKHEREQHATELERLKSVEQGKLSEEERQKIKRLERETADKEQQAQWYRSYFSHSGEWTGSFG